MTHRFINALVCLMLVRIASADEPLKPIPRVLPPPGIELSQGTRGEIQTKLKALDERLKKLKPDQVGPQQDVAAVVASPPIGRDVDIYAKAVRFALQNDEFYSEKSAQIALDLLQRATRRLDAIDAGKPYLPERGQFVVGFYSWIDGSIQPYGLEIPADLDLTKPVPLYVWLHGRGDKETDLYFIKSRDGGKPGELHPANAIVFDLFGRSCLGFKSAGETDLLEAIDDVESRYKIDADRIVLAGFSMGGAGAWHLGAHFADQFCAVHAGAGFADVARYQHLKPEQYPVWYEQTLWGQYDVPDYTRNLFNTTMIAYGGEIDPQRASSEIMAGMFKAEGHTLTRIVGPKMGHKYDPASLKEIRQLLAEAVEKGRDRFPRKVSLQTRTLHYSKMFWVTIQELDEHWKDSRVDAEAVDGSHIAVTTKNVRAFRLTSPWASRREQGPIEVTVDGKTLKVDDQHVLVKFEFDRGANGWELRTTDTKANPPRKFPGSQGPIDDAFVSPFLVVTPSGKSRNPAVQNWVDFELAHFIRRWRETFRGEVRIKKDNEVSDDDMSRYSLILWGDPDSNSVIARVMKQLPMKWSEKELSIVGKTYDAAAHVPVMIYPNLDKKVIIPRYIVINSGPTFREASDHTNSLQNPKLPDWAVIDLSTPPDAAAPGKIVAADFFDEHWQVKPAK